MARKKLIYTSEHPYHIMARSNNKEWFRLSIEECWPIFIEYIKLAQEKFDFKVYAFVLMSNHYHMIASCSAEHNLGEVMAWLQRSISKAINARTHRINHIFGGPYKACLIRHPAHFASVFKYVLRNPLQAEIVDDVKKYPFSTFTRKSVEVCRRDEWSVDIPEETDDLCKWLNTDFPNSSYKTIQAELKQTIFNPRDRDSREILFP